MAARPATDRTSAAVFGLLLALLPLVSFAQGRFVKAGDKAFANMAYTRAIASYERAAEKAVPDTGYAREQAKCYLNVRDFERAERWYARAVAMPNAAPEVLYDHAQVLRANGKYEEADTWLEAYKKQNPGDSRIKRQTNSRTYATKLAARPVPGCVVTNAGINTAGADMGASYQGSTGIVFASDRKRRVHEWRRHSWNGQPFLDLFGAPIMADGPGVPLPFAAINTRYHESNATFTPDGGTVYFTRNDLYQGKKGTDAKGVTKLRIHSRTLREGAWTDERPFPFNSEGCSVGHPCLSPDGNTLFFTSDRPGGVGGTDIWKTERVGTEWGTPVCLGTEVNTEGDEMFPFIGQDGTFAFASDGHAGLGGLDIIVGKMRADGTVSGVKNPGVPVNSGHDDFALVLDGTMLRGWFTSDRPGGKGSDDIYMISLERPLGNSMRVEGTITDRIANVPIPGALIEMKDQQGGLVASATSGSSGEYSLDLEPERAYGLSASMPAYRATKLDLASGPDVDTVFRYDLRLAKAAEVTAWLHVTDARSGEPLSGAVIQATELGDGPVEAINGQTDDSGDLRQTLQNRAAGDRIAFRVRLTRPGYFPKKANIQHTIQSDGELAMHQQADLTMEPMELGSEVGKAISVNPIHFDVGRWNIRPDAAIELDKVVTVMNENPTMAIELGSHTDSRGSDRANRVLSDKRAKSSAAYIISKGIDKERVKAKGYGESRLLNGCGNKSQCTEEGHQQNRRTEFIITGM